MDHQKWFKVIQKARYYYTQSYPNLFKITRNQPKIISVDLKRLVTVREVCCSNTYPLDYVSPLSLLTAFDDLIALQSHNHLKNRLNNNYNQAPCQTLFYLKGQPNVILYTYRYRSNEQKKKKTKQTTIKISFANKPNDIL